MATMIANTIPFETSDNSFQNFRMGRNIQITTKPKQYFKNLDGLRFFCFLSVFFYHSFASQYSYIIGDPVYKFIKWTIFGNGNMGVNCFFVLSGFLITHLLLSEKEKNGHIHIGNFYLRRVLRIWPLFYFCVFFGFVVFRFIKLHMGAVPNETAHPFYYFAFLNNFDFLKHGTDSSVLSILWSIAVEEQFYLVWPLLIAFTSRKALPYLFGLILAGSYLFRYVHADNSSLLEFHTFSCISDLCVGGLGAYLIAYSFKFSRFIKNMNRPAVALIYFCCFALFFFRGTIFNHGAFALALDRFIVSIVFLLIILEQNYAHSLFKLGNYKRISRLGIFTYGLYCLHMIGILAASVVLNKMGWNKHLWQVIILEGGLSLGIAIALAYVSYTYYEKPFLRLKVMFSPINAQ